MRGELRYRHIWSYPTVFLLPTGALEIVSAAGECEHAFCVKVKIAGDIQTLLDVSNLIEPGVDRRGPKQGIHRLRRWR